MTQKQQPSLSIQLPGLTNALAGSSLPEDAEKSFPVSRLARIRFGLHAAPFTSSGSVIFPDFFAARQLAAKLNDLRQGLPPLKAGALNAMAILHEISHVVCNYYREKINAQAFGMALDEIKNTIGDTQTHALLIGFLDQFPPKDVFDGKIDAESWLRASTNNISNAQIALEELFLVRLANENPAFSPYRFLFDDSGLRNKFPVDRALAALESSFKKQPGFGPGNEDLAQILRAPMRSSPDSLSGQLAFVRTRWGLLIGAFLDKLLGGVDMLAEEEKPWFPPGPGPSQVLSFEKAEHEYERFTMDKDWMPRVVMMAKSVLVWLDQLSKNYKRDIRTLDAVPDGELDMLASRGFNALWLIGLWERSDASRRIKELCGNPEAAASAYALFDYEIAGELGGWGALENLRRRAGIRGIRLAADMVPNHTGIDSAWVRQRPDLFIQRGSAPFPGYSFSGENLSRDPGIGIWLEDHYYDKRDAAVVFKRVDFATGETRYIYHGNDGTSMPWNDTAQIDFLKPEARAAVIERILHVARNFSIIRFDAAMIMAKRHFRRLWYPEPGHGGDIASRGEYAMPRDEFDRRMPEEFWREVVDTCATETPDTLLLAEAFWMMEGYFVRTLGMHRVYNSAFMNMLRQKENKKYRDTIKNTQEFDKDILKRFVNFMNNPDEETAASQFGKDDHYIGVCTLMATLPGLPMFGHGQVEGFSEKYGMEYRRAYKDESPDQNLVYRHENEIFPLLKRRYLFSGVEHFALYNVFRQDGTVDENIYAFSNGHGDERALVLFNNAWERSSGTIHHSCPWAEKLPDGCRSLVETTIGKALGLSHGSAKFLVMQAQKTRLWYLRRSDGIHSSGMYLCLNGFEAQVFLNFREVDDTPGRAYTKLFSRLSGAGVPDMNAAMQDIEHEDLYAAWTPIFAGAFDSCAPAKTAGATAADIGKAILTLLDQSGLALPADEKADALRIAGDAKKIAGALEAIAGFLTAFYAQKKILPTMEQQATLAGAIRICVMLEAVRSAMPPAGAATPAQGASPTATAADLLREYGLDRKLTEAMTAAGMTMESAASSLSFAIVASPFLALSARNPATLIQAILTDEDARSMLGVNTWQGQTWFNKERFEFGLGLASCLSVIRPALLGEKAMTAAEAGLALAIKNIYDPLHKMAETSGWKLNLFQEACAAWLPSGMKGAD